MKCGFTLGKLVRPSVKRKIHLILTREPSVMSLEDRIMKLEKSLRRRTTLAIASGAALFFLIACDDGRPSISLPPAKAEKNDVQNTTIQDIKARSILVAGDNGVSVKISKFGIRVKKGDDSTVMSPFELTAETKGSRSSVYSPGLVVAGDDFKSEILPNGISVFKSKFAKRGDLKAIKAETKNKRRLVFIGRSVGDAGIIDVYNPLGKVAVSMQSSKLNLGAVFLMDPNGKVTNIVGAK